MKHLFLILLSLTGGMVSAQSGPPLSLDQCRTLAREHYPLLRQNGLVEEVYHRQSAALDKAFLPRISLNAQASYQSDVTSVPISLPGVEIPAVKRDQYKAWVELQQPILDGGRVRQSRESAGAELQTARQEVEVQLFRIENKVNEAFFALLLLQENGKRLDAMEKELGDRLEQVRSGIRNGVVLPREADVIRAEILQVGQSRINLEENRRALLEVLEQWTGRAMSPDTELETPDPASLPLVEAADLRSRPEQELFRLQQKQVAVGLKSLDTGRQPNLSAFGQGGYGRPALNMLETSFQPYFIVGLRFSWAPFDWGMSREQKAALEVRREMIDVQQSVFEYNLQSALRQAEADMRRLERLLEGDAAIIELKASISRTTASQMQNGTATATDYLHHLNAEYLARLEQETHRIQLLQAQVNYLNLQGK